MDFVDFFIRNVYLFLFKLYNFIYSLVFYIGLILLRGNVNCIEFLWF